MKIWRIAGKIPKECTGGDCYVVSGRYMMDHCFIGNENLSLVHGTVTGQRKIEGVKYDHAWIEDGDMVIDKSCGRDLHIPKPVYYAIGRIENTKRYNCQEFRQMINKYKHWGPW